MKRIGERLRQERMRLGLSQAAMAAIGGIQPNAQGAYETGKRSPRAVYLSKIAAAGVNPIYVLNGNPVSDLHSEAEGESNPAILEVQTSPNLLNDAERRMPSEHAQQIITQLRRSIWTTADAIAELSRLADPSDSRTARDHIAHYLSDLDLPNQRLADEILARPNRGEGKRN
ncbi:helix-turn-helix domain-containing protein [Pseudomonas sp. RC10]|uniref:helix-turn-helix domain-containing protein n=1 Tax=Pseudomonas bambusae TaxID=3139142 RepID=UPI003139A94E